MAMLACILMFGSFLGLFLQNNSVKYPNSAYSREHELLSFSNFDLFFQFWRSLGPLTYSVWDVSDSDTLSLVLFRLLLKLPSVCCLATFNHLFLRLPSFRCCLCLSFVFFALFVVRSVALLIVQFRGHASPKPLFKFRNVLKHSEIACN